MIKNFEILCAHGFGVRKDDRGLFTDLAACMPDRRIHMLDMNDVDDQTGNLRTPPLEEQARRLSVHAQKLDQKYIVVAHSMGCLVTCLSTLPGMTRAIFLAPPSKVDIEKTVKSFSERPGSVINMDGESILARRDGTQTIVLASFWKSKTGPKNDPAILLHNFMHAPVDLIQASEDEVLGQTDFLNLPSHFTLHTLSGDHNFSGPDRRPLLDYIQSLINQ